MSDHDRPRVIRVELSVEKGKIVTSLASSEIDALFHIEDKRMETKTGDAQTEAKKRKEDFKDHDIPVRPGQRTQAADYDPADEPKYDHAGLHLRFNGEDQIIWFTNVADIDIRIEVGPDPELYYFRGVDEGHGLPMKADLRGKAQSSFNEGIFSCTKGFEAASGTLLDIDRVRKQRYFKFSMIGTYPNGTTVKGDPHYEGHDD